jgi:protoheme IX farnesyltransferase
VTSSPSIKDLLALCKLKVVSLILLTAVVGMLLAVPYLPNFLLIVVASVGISLSAMSAAVFNHIIDEKIDAQMSRTDLRPLPKGKVTRNQALIWGLFLGFVGIGLLFFFVNILTAVLTFLSLIGYAVFLYDVFKTCNPTKHRYWRGCWSCTPSSWVDLGCWFSRY